MIRLVMNPKSIAVAVLLAVAPLAAHHSISAEFDTNHQITLSGIVTNVDWMNPHTYVFVDVKEPGKTTNWACELDNPRELARKGFTRNSVKVGMTVSVTGNRAKNGSFRLHIDALTANGGRLLGK
jgi:hypothetical protein